MSLAVSNVTIERDAIAPIWPRIGRCASGWDPPKVDCGTGNSLWPGPASCRKDLNLVTLVDQAVRNTPSGLGSLLAAKGSVDNRCEMVTSY